MKKFSGRGLLRGFAALTVAVGISAAAAGPVAAAQPDCVGKGVPTSKISVQLYTFADYVGFGEDEATQARLEETLSRLADMGYKNVEPFTLNGLSAEEFRALLDKYGLKASARHVCVGTPEDPQDIDAILEENRILGIKYFGSGSTPIFQEEPYTTEAEWLAYAAYLDEVGEQARKAGQTLFIHNHHIEFLQTFDGQTAFDILMDNTDPRNVSSQLDLYWAVTAGQDPVALLDEYGKRIKLFHVKDADASGAIEIVGEGTIDFPSIFEAAGGGIRYYVVEHDPRFDDPTFDPFEAAQTGFDYLTCVSN